jgi:hypothetical protein
MASTPTTFESIPISNVPDISKKLPNTIPAKYFKNIAFGYWLLLKSKDEHLIDETTFNTFMKDYLKVYSSISDQMEYYDSFDADFKMVSKDLKKMIKDFHKPPKTKKPKKEKTLKADTSEDPKPTKRGRPKKDTSKDNDDDDLVSSIVSAAFDSIKEKPKRVYVRKSKKTQGSKIEEPEVEEHKVEEPEVEKPKIEEPKIEGNEDDDVDENVLIDYCIGCETGADNDDAHINYRTGLHWKDCECHDNELISFTFTQDNFKCLLHKPSLKLFHHNTQNLLNTTHSLSRINLHTLHDHNNFSYSI